MCADTSSAAQNNTYLDFFGISAEKIWVFVLQIDHDAFDFVGERLEQLFGFALQWLCLKDLSF